MNGAMNSAMNERDQEQIVLEDALRALEHTAGVHGRVVAREQAAPGIPYRADALVEIVVGGEPYRFIAEVKAAVERVPAIGHVKALLDHLRRGLPGHNPLLVTRFMTPRMAEVCRHLDLPYIDTAGNAYLRGPGLFVYVAGQNKPKNLETVKYRANTQVGLKIVFALLSNLRVAATYREIAHHAGVALGAVGPVLKDLEERGFIRKTWSKSVVLENKRQLFDEWITRYPEVLRPKLGLRRYQADPDKLLGADLVGLGLEAYWGGEKAAELLTGYLYPERFTLYVRGHVPEILTKLRMRLDPQGNAEVLEAFWNPELDKAGEPVAPAMLVYADLMTTGIARNVEAAKLVYERFIEPALVAD
jgi:hypothetical protein